MSTPRTFRDSLFAMLGISSVVMIVAIDQTVVSTALPSIVAELAGFDYYAWVATAYLLMSVITIPIFGRLGDFYGRKPLVVIAILVFIAASIACAFSINMLWLVIARGFQGIGAGMLIGTAFASIPDLFPDPRVRLRWQVIVTSAFGVANAIGPSLGGFLSHAYGWRSVFYINLPIGLLGLFFVSRYLPHIRHADRGGGRIDWPGAVLITLGLGSLQLLLQFVPRYGYTWTMGALAVLCCGAFAALVRCERRSENPLLPLQMFTHPTVGGLALLALLTGFCMFILLFYVPLMLQGGFGLSAHDSGLLITPLVVCITFGSLVNGRIVTRIRVPNVMLYVGFGLLSVACIGVALTEVSTPHGWMMGYMVVGGIGLGFIMPNLMVFSQEVTDRSQLGIVTAMLQSVRMIGGMLGTATVGAAVAELYEGGVERATLAADAQEFAAQLSDPQVLVNEQARATFMQQADMAGLNGAALIESARASLVSAIHHGQVAAIAAAVLALWRVRAVPPIVFRKR